jgi:beta-lactamase class A
MKRLYMPSLIALALSTLVSASPAPADQITPTAAVERLFTSEKIDADWFASSFLQQVTVGQVQSILDQFKQQLGAFQSVRPDGDHFSTELEKGSIPTYVSLDGTGRIIGLLFKAPALRTKDVNAALAAFKQLPGEVSLVIVSGGKPTTEYNADKALAVGSAFKLAVLAAIKKQAAVGRMSWSQIVTLKQEWKSLPSGILQTWPVGSPLTLSTVAALMISQSDNTAADHALLTVGRPAVQAESPRNQPFLTTREAFQLKDPKNAALLTKWRNGDKLARREVIASLAPLPLPSVDIFNGGVTDPDIEWFFTVKELCSLMADVASLPLTSINPGVADPARWAHVSYKGGSEPGVLNLTTQVTSKAGKTYCVSATWNDAKPLDEKQFELQYGTLLNSLE